MLAPNRCAFVTEDQERWSGGACIEEVIVPFVQIVRATSAGDQRTVGLDRLVRLEWMDAAAGQLAAGMLPRSPGTTSGSYLRSVAGSTTSPARGKTIAVLARCGFRRRCCSAPPRCCRGGSRSRVGGRAPRDPFGDVFRGLSILRRCRRDWSGKAWHSTARWRCLSSPGVHCDTPKQSRNSAHSVWPHNSLQCAPWVQWGSLRDGGKVGLYLAPQKKAVLPSAIVEFLLEGLLVSAQRGVPFSRRWRVIRPCFRCPTVHADNTSLQS